MPCLMIRPFRRGRHQRARHGRGSSVGCYFSLHYRQVGWAGSEEEWRGTRESSRAAASEGKKQRKSGTGTAAVGGMSGRALQEAGRQRHQAQAGTRGPSG